MTDNRPLSDRRFSNELGLKRPVKYPYYLEDDVREAVKKLKEKAYEWIDVVNSPEDIQAFNHIIDEVFGKELSE